MSKNPLVSLTYLTSIILVFFGAWSMILHRPNATLIITIGLAGILIFTLVALYEIHSSKKIERMEKIIWTLGFFLVNVITGLIYYLGYRRNIVGRQV